VDGEVRVAQEWRRARAARGCSRACPDALGPVKKDNDCAALAAGHVCCCWSAAVAVSPAPIPAKGKLRRCVTLDLRVHCSARRSRT
jgi:hypothetical protein